MPSLNPTEAVEKLGMSYANLMRLLKKGAFTDAKKVRGSWQIPLKAVEDYKASLNAPDGYLTIAEVAKRLNLTELWVGKLTKKGSFVGAKKHRGSWIVPSISLEEYIDSFSTPEGFFSLSEAAEYLSVSEAWVRKLILKKVLTGIEVIKGVRYIREDCMKNYLKSILPPEGYFSTAQAAQELLVSKLVINVLAKAGTFPGAKKQKIPYHHAGWIIPINAVNQYKKTHPFPKEFVPYTNIAAQLGVSKDWVIKLIRAGVIYKDIKQNNEWIVPVKKSIDFVEKEKKRQQEMAKLLTPIDLFEYRLARLEVPKSLRKTMELYREFVILKINSSLGNSKTLHNLALKFSSTFKKLLRLLETEVFLMNAEQLYLIFHNPEIGIQDKRTFSSFLEFCTGKGLCTFSKNYAVTPVPVEEREMYSPERFLDYYNYVKDIDLHLQRAIESRDYAVTWLYVLMHVIDAWRPSDIIKLPNIMLDFHNLQTFDQLKEKKLSLEQAQAVINHMYRRVERMYISKTGSLGHFLVNQDMIVPTATVLVITEIHRRSEGDQQLIRVGKRKFAHFDKETHFRSFFKKRPNLVDFQSRKMNRTLLTYFFYSVVEGKENANIAYELSQQVRGHIDINTTATYIQSTNKDGSIERVSLNLFNRGHFGWLYHHLISLFMPDGPQLGLEQSTALIEKFRKEFSPYQLEQLSYFLVRQQKSKKSLALQLSNITEKDLETLLYKVYKGEMPAKLQHVQCLTYPNCTSPTAMTCLQCENAIPKIYILISIYHELDRLIVSIQNTKYPATRIRDSKFLFQILDLLSQAVQQFGKNYVETFVDLNNIKLKILAIQNLISGEI
ncbi:helix-turn-helix domain-containing protein [Paenibacillus sp. Mc5Re-14]|uniref:helix-turn-helix domain-containing protein n=1 Tax=Paenibacillus sp. Mc5Re-14 TaxID=1030529 RepID=UPI000A92C702|nr:helix-turn-helix domain-containing protein [Paenibacillus sp. Mc5Re-14]